ncbi:MAG: uracil-DNA glycosylase [Elusimicrobia bacterium CG06_land_8_20_14_3_00_38_11]|nr:MAG: uracil-DNA glycosylase [Elusimicrobia bacterium CG06_land_8_20_14_3_00_38_11]
MKKRKKNIADGKLKKLAEEIKNCKKCPLHKSRKNAVPGEGNPEAKLMFIGEGPGFDEDRLGRPFVGRSGQLLDKIILAMGMKREDVFIANIVKCHPMVDPSHPDERGNDRKPSSDEINGCISYLEKQIEIIKPKIICSLGSVSATTLTGISAPLGKLRGKFHDYYCSPRIHSGVSHANRIKLMPTFHPAALLRNPNWKKDAWEDMKKIMKEFNGKGKK